MQMHDSTSSQIARFGYDAAAKTLRVEFRTGGKCVYANVPEDKFTEMQAADSHGKFLHSRVKPYHAWTRVQPPENILIPNSLETLPQED